MSLIFISVLAVSIVVAALCGYFFGKRNDSYKQFYNQLFLEHEALEQKFSDISTSLTRFQTRSEHQENENQKLMQRYTDLETKLMNAKEALSSLEAKQEFYEQQRSTDIKEIETLSYQKEALEKQKSDLEIRLNTTLHKNHDLNQRLETQNQEFIRLQKNSEQTFENLAHKIFDEKAKSFTQKSEKTLNDALAPVKESFGIFQNLVTEKFSSQDKQQYVLKEELKRIIDINEKMTFQADNLTKALKGDNKVMGNWGEMLLERILEDSGLTKDIDYVLQASGYDLRDEHGKKQIPDVIVKLPDNKEIIIDAKVSLVDYERYISEENDPSKHEKNFLKSLRNHIDGLASKKYYQNNKLLSPDFVLMFTPVEGAYNLAMQLDPQLHHYAWDRRIAIVTNTTLFATLRTVSSLWRIEKQNKNAQEIANRAGLLYEKFAGFIGDMESIDKKFNETHKLFDNALGKLHQGRGNLISQVENLKQLGAKTSKSLPKEYLQEVTYEEAE